MGLAIKAGRRARVWSSPNPAVGCAIVKDDEVLATGFTHPTGQAHAEVHALSQVADAMGSTVYVTLEPCAHTGRTPPCTQALIDAGVSRVVIACIDPDERVAGKGVDQLRSAGIDVALGVCSAEAAEDLAGFFLRLKRGYGRVTVKMAMSADGRTAMASGESQWITGEKARADVQAWRACSDVILTGSGTVKADDCSLTLRPCDNRLDSDDWTRAMICPTPRAVIDTRASTSASANVVSAGTPTTLFSKAGVTLDTSMPSEVNHVVVPTEGAGLDVREVLMALGEQGANEILVEAGPTLVGALEQASLIDQWLLYMAPTLFGADARPVNYAVFNSLGQANRYSITAHDLIGDDLRIIMRQVLRD